MNDEPKKQLPIESGRRIRTRQEKLLETREGKLERLMDLTGIETEEELVDIYTELLEVIRKINIENISYEVNDVGLLQDRSENQFVFANLNDEELKDLENALRKLSIFGFPENVENSNKVNLYIENKKNLEILRLITVSDFIRKEKDAAEANKRFEARKKYWTEQRVQNEKRQRDIARQIVDKAMEDWKKRLQERVEEYDKEQERKTRIRMENALSERLRENKVDLSGSKEKTEEEIKKEQIRLERDQKYEEILKVLEKIEPQKIDISEEILDVENDPYHAVSGYRGYIPETFPPHKRRKKEEFTNVYVEDLDPKELDEEIKEIDEAWTSGRIADELSRINEEKIFKRPKVLANLSIFPDKYKWVYDKNKKTNRMYEYDKATNTFGKEITRANIEDDFQHLKFLRAERIAKEKKLELDPKKGLPKSKEETDYELKVILYYKSLIMWLIKELTSNYIKGNNHLRKSDPDDLFQICIMGLFYAVDRSEIEKRNANTSTSYVMACMEGFMRTSSTKNRNFQLEQVRSPEGIIDTRRRINKIIRLLEREFPKQKVTDEMIAVALAKPGIGIIKFIQDPEEPNKNIDFDNLNKQELDILVGKYKQLRDKLLMDYSEVAYEAIYDESKDIDTRVDMLARELHVKNSAEDNVETSKLKRAVSQALATLTPREERVLRLRFGIGMENKETAERKPFSNGASYSETNLDGLTLDEVGEVFSVTRERIRQIEAKALRKLKHPSRTRSLRKFLPSFSENNKKVNKNYYSE